MPEIEKVVAGRKSQAQILLEHVAAGVSSANQPAKVMGVSKERISHLTAQLLKKKKLTKEGRSSHRPRIRKYLAASVPAVARPSRSSKGPRRLK